MSKTLTMLVGPPGSGKSTFSKQLVQTAFRKKAPVYVNQDSQGVDHFAVFDDALLAGDDIVVDRMNFNKEQRGRYLRLAKDFGYRTKIVVLHQPYDVCFERIMNRKNHETIKDEKAARGALHTFFTRYERVSDDEADEIERVWPKGDKRYAIICDLDGTLCNIEHRLVYVKNSPKDWKAFFQNLDKDTPNQWCVDLLKGLSKQYAIVYCSGRPRDHKEQTVEWLKKYGLDKLNWAGLIGHNDRYDFYLYMRAGGDFRRDDIVKEIILDFEILTRFTPYLMIDDRQQVVDMWRKRGYTCLQCAPGDF